MAQWLLFLSKSFRNIFSTIVHKKVAWPKLWDGRWADCNYCLTFLLLCLLLLGPLSYLTFIQKDKMAKWQNGKISLSVPQVKIEAGSKTKSKCNIHSILIWRDYLLTQSNCQETSGEFRILLQLFCIPESEIWCFPWYYYGCNR